MSAPSRGHSAPRHRGAPPAAGRHNADIARVFDEIADLLELSNGNPFRVRAYRNAARVLTDLRGDVALPLSRGEPLRKLPGIGTDLAGKIGEIVATGTCALREQLAGRAPAGITELLRIPGLGPKRVNTLNRKLGVHTLAQLEQALSEGRVRTLPRFGERSEQRLRESVRAALSKGRRYKLAVAAQYALPLADHLRSAPGVREVAIAGSFRRMRDTVGDLDLVAAAPDPDGAIQALVAYPEVKEVLAFGGTKASVLLASGIQVDLRVVPAHSFGAALHYSTGSKAHNIALRRLAQARGLKINEYGVFRGTRRIAGETEESVYAALDLPCFEPELREDQGELEAARRGELPQLVTLADLQGDLHCHTRATDGRNTLSEMAEAARAQGLKYVAITEHSRHVAMAHGLDSSRLGSQVREIERLNDTLSEITVLTGIEVDILEDGALDLPDTALAKLDVVVAAVHSAFSLSRERQTERIMKALENPHVNVLAHPTGRLIEERPAYEVDLEAIIRKAKGRGVALELNSHPDRLDLNDTHCRMAKAEGLLVSINSDAHGTDGFDALRFGVGQARRGWLEKKDVLNTRPLAELRRWLEGERA